LPIFPGSKFFSEFQVAFSEKWYMFFQPYQSFRVFILRFVGYNDLSTISKRFRPNRMQTKPNDDFFGHEMEKGPPLFPNF